MGVGVEGIEVQRPDGCVADVCMSAGNVVIATTAGGVTYAARANLTCGDRDTTREVQYHDRVQLEMGGACTKVATDAASALAAMCINCPNKRIDSNLRDD